MIAIVTLGPILLLAVLWWLLDRHEKRRAADGQPRHSGFRLFMASAAILAALFTGGCSLLFAANMDGTYATPEAIAVIGGIPFVGAAMWSFVALARRRSAWTMLGLLIAVFITAFYAVAAASLTGLAPAIDPFIPGLVVAGLVTAVAGLWLFFARNPANPPSP